MDRMGRARLLAIFLALPLAVISAEDEVTKAPYVEVGDCWSYQTTGTEFRGAPTEYEVCVVFIDTAKDVIMAVATTKADGKEVETSYSLRWDPRVTRTRLIIPSGTRFFRFPMRAGDTFETEYEFKDAQRGPNAGKAKMRHKVVGWESVTVPAGTFRGMRTDSEGTVQRYDRMYTFAQTQSTWYVPEVNRVVKYRYENPDRWVQEELTGYRLKK